MNNNNAFEYVSETSRNVVFLNALQSIGDNKLLRSENWLDDLYDVTDHGPDDKTIEEASVVTKASVVRKALFMF